MTGGERGEASEVSPNPVKGSTRKGKKKEKRSGNSKSRTLKFSHFNSHFIEVSEIVRFVMSLEKPL